MQKKIRCIVCGQRFTVDKGSLYDVEEPHGLSAVFYGGVRVLSAMDCPACGCQNRLTERWPAVSDTEETEDEES